MLKSHQNLSETHILGEGTRLKSVTAETCPALRLREIAHVGVGDAEAPYSVVRLDLSGAYLHGSISGEGRVLLDGRWQVHSGGMTSFAPAHVLHAFHAINGVPWRVCWLRYMPSSARSMPGTMAPVLADFDPLPLSQAIIGLCEESIGGSNDQGTCTLWVDLIEKYVSRFTEPWRQDERLARVWAAVQADLGRAWTVSDFAGLAKVSTEHFRRLCHQGLGRSPLKQLIDLRMQHAAHMLVSTDHTIEVIANVVGYENAFVFSNMFARTVGMRPSKFRKTARATESGNHR